MNGREGGRTMGQVEAVPEGYHTITPFLNVEGARDAIAFYKKAFGAEERAIMPGPDGKIMHSEIKIGDSIVMLSDAMMQPATQAALHLYVQDADALWARATAAGCKVILPIADQFWGDRYGVLGDKWGNRWSIAQHKEDFSPEEMRRRAEEAMKQMSRKP
jgi:PhnB protein